MEFVSVFLGLFLWTLFLLIFPFFIVLLIYRLIVNYVASFQNPSLSPLPRSDQINTCPKGIWLLLVGALKLKGQTNLQEFREHFRKTFLAEADSVFYKEVVQIGGYGFTKFSEIDLNFHIREVHIENLETNFNTILNQLANDNKTIEKSGRPSWEILICNNEKKSLVVIKIHHALADGYSLVTIIDKLTGNKSPYLVKAWDHSAWKKMKICMKTPFEYLRHALDFGPNLKKHPFGIIKKKNLENQSSILTSTVTLDYKKIKEIRAHAKCRVIPILICVQVEALRRYLIESGRITENSSKFQKYYKALSILPIPDHPAVREGRICNHCVPGISRVPLQEPNLMKRLVKTNNSFESWEEKDVDKINANLRFTLNLFPYWIFKHFQYLGNFPHYSMLSTLILSKEKYTLLGNILENAYFCCTFHPKYANFKGIKMYTFTRGNEMDVCIRGSNDLFKTQGEIDLYANKYFVQVLNEYFATALTDI